ncbi:MAG: hypothetical protein Q9222_005145 [Ikaeria aurantiellina]
MRTFTAILVAAFAFALLALCDSASNAAPAGLDRRDGSVSTFIKREAYYNETSHSIELSPRSVSQASLERRQQGLRLYWDTARRYRVLFRGNFENIALFQAFVRSTNNVAQGLASALRDFLVQQGHNVDVWGHHTNIDGSDAGTLGVSIRDLGTGGFMALRAAIQDFFEQHPDTHFVLQQCPNAFDLSAFGFRNPPGNGPAARKRNAENAELSKRQSVGGGASGPVSTDFCNAPIDKIWNMVDGPPTASYDFTEHC